MKKTFDELTDAIATHRAMMAKILAEHAEKKQRNHEFFEPVVAKSQNANLCKFSRARITKCDNELSRAIKNALSIMRAELERLAREPADHTLIDNLRMMQEFDVRMTPDDLKAYVKAADGNLAAYFCIDALARQNGCALCGGGIGDLQRSIDDLEAMSETPTLIAPDECMSTALELFPRGTTEADVRQSAERMDEFAAEKMPQLLKLWTSKIEPAVIPAH